jgi:hypothetical protein
MNGNGGYFPRRDWLKSAGVGLGDEHRRNPQLARNRSVDRTNADESMKAHGIAKVRKGNDDERRTV